MNHVQIASSSNSFGFNVWSKINEGTDNLALSPFTLSTALLMTYAGARGRTAESMATALQLNNVPMDTIVRDWAMMASMLKATPRVILRIANRIFGDISYEFNEKFVRDLDEAFNAGIETVDFKSSELSRTFINKWVEAQTENKIKDLLPPGSVDSQTSLVLTSAAYFLADWRSAFPKKGTISRPFRLLDGNTTSCKMMNSKDTYNYGTDGQVQLLELPYVGDAISMLVALPSAGNFKEMESSLTAERFENWRSILRSKEIKVGLPMFELNNGKDLTESLKALGMDVFSMESDFSGMGNEHVHISSILTKNFVKIDEKGTEAASATAVVMTRSIDMTPQFLADRPFMFFIVDRATGVILFQGRVTDPNKN